ncbi:MAG: hypothetical protein EOO75_00780 [Myxococcales bacterium]|nr:MAG: hypothetical protein EOO75_00780 [Myxococcales bacterium]
MLLGGRLWVSTTRGDVWAIDEDSGKAQGWQFEAPATAMTRTRDGRLLVVTSAPEARRGSLWEFRGRGWSRLRSWLREDGSRPMALTEEEGQLVIVENRRVRLIAPDGHAREVALGEPLRGGHHVSAALAGGQVYVGLDQGEFGGGLWRIDLATGERRELHGDGLPSAEAQKDPRLSGGGSPVTAVVAERDRPGCVLASVGMSHMGLSHGGLFRACGDAIERVWSAPLSHCDASDPFALCEQSEAAVWDVIALPGGFWASTSNGIVRRDQGQPDRWWTSVESERRGGVLQSSSVPGLRLIWSDAHAAVSVGVYGALLVPTE